MEVLSYDGLKLRGRYYHYKDDAPFVLLMHGYRGCALGDFCGGFYIFRRLGFNILLANERACGLSEGRLITFGIKESLDVGSWIDYLKERFGCGIRICLYGVSLGSATVMMATARDLPENVRCIIADCGYSSPKEQIRHVAGDKKLPPGICWFLARTAARIVGGFDPGSLSAIEAVAETDIPILFIHGENDTFVPF